MDQPVDLRPATETMKALLPGIRDEHLASSTPCERYVVADLLDHVVGLTAAFTHAARKSTALADQAPEPKGADLDPEWRRNLPGQLDALADAWADPAAWAGEARAGGVTMPAAIMGRVALNEIVVHGWDLARATGQSHSADPATVSECLGFVEPSASEEGVEGLFGPTVRVAADASEFDRLVGLTGRDPGWTP